MAPTNEAFAQLPPNLLKFLLDPANKADLVRVLTYHVIGSKILAADLTNGEELLTLEGGHERVTLYNKEVFINFAQVVAADNFATNGERRHGVSCRCCCASPLVCRSRAHHQPCPLPPRLDQRTLFPSPTLCCVVK